MSASFPSPDGSSWRNWTQFLGPGIVMMGIQIGGGEWLLGPEVTAKYGGGLMWIATVAIVLQVFYNLECRPVRALLRRADLHRVLAHQSGTAVLDGRSSCS